MALNTGAAVGYNSVNITAAAPTTTVVKTGQGILHTICFNKPTATAVVTLYDNTAASGTVLATITTPNIPIPVTLNYDLVFTNGLTITSATAAQDITITYI